MTSRDECLEAARLRAEKHFIAKEKLKKTKTKKKPKTDRHSIMACVSCKRDVCVHINGRICRHRCSHDLWCRGNAGDVPWDVCAVCRG